MQKAFSKVWLVILAVVLIGIALFAAQGEFLQGRFGSMISSRTVTKGEVLDTMLVDAGYTLQPCEGTYPDLPTTHTYCQAIETAINEGIISVNKDGTAGVDDNLSKAEAAKVASLAYELTLVTPSVATFADVGNADWYYSYVETLAAAGAVSATTNFNPDDEMKVTHLKYWTFHLSR